MQEEPDIASVTFLPQMHSSHRVMRKHTEGALNNTAGLQSSSVKIIKIKEKLMNQSSAQETREKWGLHRKACPDPLATKDTVGNSEAWNSSGVSLNFLPLMLHRSHVCRNVLVCRSYMPKINSVGIWHNFGNLFWNDSSTWNFQKFGIVPNF